jgi:hypothetical protein
MSDLTDRSAWECVLYTVNGDESADETKSRVFAVSGVFGSEQDWDELKRAWVERTGGVIFHATECETNQGDFKETSDPENKALYKDLVRLLCESHLMGRSFAMDMIGWNKHFAGALEDIPYLTCFRNVVYECGHLASLSVPQDNVEFTFDQHPETNHNAGVLYTYMAQMKEWSASPYLHHKVSFASRKYVGIQVADLLARETMKHLDNQVGPVKRPTRLSFKALLAAKRFSFSFLTESYFESFRRNIDRLSDQRGVDYGDYQRWLEENGLINNMSNVHRYMIGKWPHGGTPSTKSGEGEL